MALVTLQDIGSESVYTIKTLFTKITVNVLFTFLNTLNDSLNRDFRISLDDGNTWQSWLDLTDANIRALDLNPNIKIVAQVRYSPNASFLLINDSEDVLLINDSGDGTLIS